MTSGHILLRKQLGTVTTGVRIPDTSGTWPSGFHPKPVTIYRPPGVVPTDISTCFVILHGGTGNSVNIARAMGILKSSVPNAINTRWELMTASNSMCIIPDGGACDGHQVLTNAGYVSTWNPNLVNTISDKYPQGATTWENFVTHCQVDDSKQYLHDIALYIIDAIGAVSRCLVGHSEGAMMVGRMMIEDPTAYAHYVLACGTPGTYYSGYPDPNTNLVHPTLFVYGGMDVNITNDPQGLGHAFQNATITQSNPTVADLNVPSTLIGPWTFYKRWVAAKDLAEPIPLISDGVTTVNTGSANVVGTTTTWNNTQHRLVVINSADHALKTIQTYSAKRLYRMIVDWLLFI